jgi:CHAD domain-containing protein
MNLTAPPPPKRVERAVSKAAHDRGAQLGAAAAVATGAAVIGGRAAARAIRSDGHDGPSRAYRLKRREKTAKGVRRIAHGRVEHALEQLRQQPDGEEVAVHTARKDLKKLRSLLRLVRGELGKSAYSAENARYRDAGRLLSDARDAEVKLQTLAALRDRFDDLPDLDGYVAALKSEQASARHGNGTLTDAARAIEAGGESIDAWDLPGGRWPPVGDGLASAYGRGRRALALVKESDGDGEAVHEWRKRSKDLWYHLRILERAWPEVLGPLAAQAHELSDLLGDHHDLSVLADDARRRPDRFPADDGARLGSAIETRQEELLAVAIPLGERLYAEKPKAYRGRMKAYWKAQRP